MEAVLATTLLGMITVMVVGSVSYLRLGEVRRSRTLAAAEIAHRLTLQRLDEKRALDPLRGKPLEYKGDFYRWELNEQNLRTREFFDDGGAANASATRTIDRLSRMTVRVWLAEDSGGAFEWAGAEGVPRFELIRVFDRLPIHNPDSMKKLIESEEGIRDLIYEMSGSGQ